MPRASGRDTSMGPVDGMRVKCKPVRTIDLHIVCHSRLLLLARVGFEKCTVALCHRCQRSCVPARVMVRYDWPPVRPAKERVTRMRGEEGVGEENTRKDKRRGETAFVERTIYASRDFSLPHAHTRTYGNTGTTSTHASQVYTTYTTPVKFPRIQWVDSYSHKTPACVCLTSVRVMV